MPAIDHLECVHCHHVAPPEGADTVCPLCAGPLLIRYDMDAWKQAVARPEGAITSASIGRYTSVLPNVEPVTLGEGGTPLLRSRRYPNLFIKQEGAKPNGSSQSRGFALAVAMAKHRGIRHLALAGGAEDAAALAAYAAAAGLSAHILMPTGECFASYVAATAYGAEVTLVNGTSLDCAHALSEAMKAAARSSGDLWLDLSSKGETFRLEGMKTLGYEIAEQLGWTSPAAILYPAADTAGMVAIRKAFEEMEQLGWTTGPSPSLYAVHAGPSPSSPETVADDFVKHIAISGEAILESTLDWAKDEGVLLSREGAAAAAAYIQLLVAGTLTPTDVVLLINPGYTSRHTDQLAAALRLKKPVPLPKSAKVGGIITPI